ncbi:MAG: hypothetical protein ACLQVI_39340 [Polyangiaceae bacterium]
MSSIESDAWGSVGGAIGTVGGASGIAATGGSGGDGTDGPGRGGAAGGCGAGGTDPGAEAYDGLRGRIGGRGGGGATTGGCAEAARSAAVGWYGVQLSSVAGFPAPGPPGAEALSGVALALATDGGGELWAVRGWGAGGAEGFVTTAGGSIVMIRIGVIGGASGGGSALAGGAEGVTCGRETSSSGILSVTFARARLSPPAPPRCDDGAASGTFATGFAISGSPSSIATSIAPSDAAPTAIAADPCSGGCDA